MKNVIKIITKVFTAAMLLMSLQTTVRAADGDEDKWRFGVALPLWAPRIDGDVTVRGRKADVDISFSELKDHLDASYALGLEARKGKFGIYGGFGYMKFSADGSLPLGGRTDSDLKFLIVDGGVSYRLVKTGEEHPFILEAIAGIRYWYVDTDLKITGGLVPGNYGDSKDLLDPIIGLRGSKYFTPKLHLDMAGDIGGFGISDNTSTLDWSAAGLVSYDFTKWFSLSAGYQALALDVSDGSGKSEKGANIVMHGALITAKLKF